MTKAIVVTGGSSQVPEFAGSTWVRMQYVLGLRKLGIESFWVDLPLAVDPFKSRRTLDNLMNKFHHLACEYNFADCYCVVYNGGEQYFGMSERQFKSLASEADVLININGYPPHSSPLLQIPRRVFIDVDPGFTQIWAGQNDLGLANFNYFFTVGQNVGTPACPVPTHGISWIPIFPPVCLDFWPPLIDERCSRFCTVADWRGSQEAELDAEYYGGKRDEFVRIIDLPQKVSQAIELSLLIGHGDYEDIKMLCEHDWILTDSYLRAGDPHSYQDYIRYSRAEFSVAKHGYVKSNSGWISDRTACYLSSGKPALVQSTGIEPHIPTGRGLLTFRTLDEAIAGVEAINSDYLSHCCAARELAERYFNSDIVLGKLMERVGL